MIKGLKRWAAGGILLREVRGLRVEVAGLRSSVERIAEALEAWNRAQQPPTYQADATTPGVDISYITDQVSQEFMEIEFALTRATGQPPTEEEVIGEFERRHAG